MCSLRLHRFLPSMLWIGFCIAWQVLSSGPLQGQEAAALGDPPEARPSPSKVRPVDQDASFGSLPLHFIENQGQVEGPVSFYVKGRDRTFHFTEEGFTCVLRGGKGEGARRWSVRLEFEDGARGVKPEGLEAAEAVYSWFRGKRASWRCGVPTWRRIVYRGVWPGIDVVFIAGMHRIESEFHVQAGADPGRIRLAYRGVSSGEVTGDGRLRVNTPLGVIEEERPRAYQGEGGAREEIPVSFAPEGGLRGDTFAFGFKVGGRDAAQSLVIDPVYLVYSGYIGGGELDSIWDIAVDKKGCAYVTGLTYSDETTFPVKVGPDLTYNDSGWPDYCDAFVAKVSADGTHLEYCGYIGGKGEDSCEAIAVDSQGNAYVAGETTSTEYDLFPLLVGPDLTHNGGGYDGFVAKVSADGTHLEYCGYIGGKGWDFAKGIAVDEAGNAYVAGYTKSSHGSFPVKVGPDLTYNGDGDGFVAKVSADGTHLEYCGYIGGSGLYGDSCFSLALDDSGYAYVCGKTSSDEYSFPVKVGPDLTYNGGSFYSGDAFVAKVKPDGTGLAYCGYIGGSAMEFARAIAVDPWGNAYVTGYTESVENTFPVKEGPGLRYSGNMDAFVAKVDATGLFLHYCGYIGGNEEDDGYGIAVDPLSHAYVVGNTRSWEATFPVKVGPDLTYNGVKDAFACEVSATGQSLLFCGYVGGSNGDFVKECALDAFQNLFLVGMTSSVDFPVLVGPDLTYNSFGDAFITKICTGKMMVLKGRKMRPPK